MKVFQFQNFYQNQNANTPMWQHGFQSIFSPILAMLAE